MAGRWLDTKLGEVLTLQRGFDLPAGDRRLGRFPVVASTGVVGTHCEPMVDGPGVVIGRSGSLGGAQYVTGDFWPLNTTLWVKDFKGNDRRFCYYLLKSLNLQTFNVGSGVPTLNRNHVHPLPVRIPADVNEQRAIARVLGALDDKIELNRQMNETLEAMARTLFKSWFIDFDPVHAKAAGRDPGLSADIAALFPDSFQDSQLGLIPQQWQARLLKDVLTESNERVGDADMAEYSSTNTGLELRSERFSKKLAESSARNKLIRHGDFIFGLSRRVLNFGLMRDRVGSVSSAYEVFRVDQQEIIPDLLERAMRQRSSYFYNAISGSSREGQSVSAEGLGQLRFAQPDVVLQQAFYHTIGPFSDLARTLGKESNSLAGIRDALLPRLISGELRVKDVDQSMEAHV